MNQTDSNSTGSRATRVKSLLAVTLLAACTAHAVAQADARGSFEDGARCLFIGHSFFVPVASAFDAMAAQNEFPSHQMSTVFRGGPAGSPQALWDNAATRTAIEAVLATGEIELFGLTSFSPENSDLGDYSLWVDLARQYNPDTRFVIGVPWVPGGPSLDTLTFNDANVASAYSTFEVIQQLRAAYPGVRIEYISYGTTASIMKGMFEAGQLPDIVGLTPDPANGVSEDAALFEDAFIGHAGPMMLEVSAISWMDILYDARIETLAFTEYQSDVAAIVAQVLDFNEQFRISCTADLNEDGRLDFFDFSAFLTLFSANDPAADLAEPIGTFDFFDVSAYLGLFGSGCP